MLEFSGPLWVYAFIFWYPIWMAQSRLWHMSREWVFSIYKKVRVRCYLAKRGQSLRWETEVCQTCPAEPLKPLLWRASALSQSPSILAEHLSHLLCFNKTKQHKMKTQISKLRPNLVKSELLGQDSQIYWPDHPNYSESLTSHAGWLQCPCRTGLPTLGNTVPGERLSKMSY